jgi:hypothetical protein
VIDSSVEVRSRSYRALAESTITLASTVSNQSGLLR